MARETVRRAIRELCGEGLLEIRRGYGTFVKRPRSREALQLHSDDHVQARMPTRDERIYLRLTAGVPALVITRATGEVEVAPADAVEARA